MSDQPTEPVRIRCALCRGCTVPGEIHYWADYGKMLPAIENGTPHNFHEACLADYLAAADEQLWRAKMLSKPSGSYSGPTAVEIGRAVRGL